MASQDNDSFHNERARQVCLLMFQRGFIAPPTMSFPSERAQYLQIDSDLRTLTTMSSALMHDPELTALRAHEGDEGHCIKAICALSDHTIAHKRLLEMLSNPLIGRSAVQPSALLTALKHGNLQVVNLLLKHPKAREAYEPTRIIMPYKHLKPFATSPFWHFGNISPLSLACCYADTDVASAMALLLLRVPFFETTAYHKTTPKGDGQHSTSDDLTTLCNYPIFIASSRNLLDVVKKMLCDRFLSCSSSCVIQEAFYAATIAGNTEVVQTFLQCGVSPFKKVSSNIVANTVALRALALENDVSRALACSFVLDDVSSGCRFLEKVNIHGVLSFLNGFVHNARTSSNPQFLACVQCLLTQSIWQLFQLDPPVLTASIVADCAEFVSTMFLTTLQMSTDASMQVIDILLTSPTIVDLLCHKNVIDAVTGILFMLRTSETPPPTPPPPSLERDGHFQQQQQQQQQLQSQQTFHLEHSASVAMQSSLASIFRVSKLSDAYVHFLNRNIDIQHDLHKDAQKSYDLARTQYAEKTTAHSALVERNSCNAAKSLAIISDSTKSVREKRAAIRAVIMSDKHIHSVLKKDSSSILFYESRCKRRKRAMDNIRRELNTLQSELSTMQETETCTVAIAATDPASRPDVAVAVADADADADGVSVDNYDNQKACEDPELQYQRMLAGSKRKRE